MLQKTVFCLLVTFASQLLAQTSMEFYQGTVKVGTLLELDHEFSAVYILTPSGYFIRYNGFSGAIRREDLYFETSDCTGQAYLTVPNLTIDDRMRGGEIIAASGTTSILKTELFPTWTDRVVGSRKSRDGCIETQSGYSLRSIPVVLEDASLYGIVPIKDPFFDTTFLGFNPKLSTKVINNDKIFCGGFEGCPSN